MDRGESAKLCEAISQAPACYADCLVERGDSPHILHHILPEKLASLPLNIITKQELEPKTPTATENDDDPDDIEDTSGEGSPLKMVEFKEDVLPGFPGTSKSYRPVSQLEARKFISLYILGVQNGCCGKDPLPLWMLCKPKQHDCLVALGVEMKVAEDGAMETRTYSVTSKGPYEKPSQLPRMSDLVKRHAFENGGSVKTKCFASYNVFGSSMKDMSVLSAGQGSLLINLEWDKANSLLQTPALDAKTTVLATVSAGDLRSAANFMYLELTVLLNFIRGLEEGVVEWAHAAEGDIDVLTQVKQLLEDLSTGTSVKRKKKKVPTATLR